MYANATLNKIAMAVRIVMVLSHAADNGATLRAASDATGKEVQMKSGHLRGIACYALKAGARRRVLDHMRMLPRLSMISIWLAFLANSSGCIGFRIGVGPNVDHLGNVGFDVKLQTNVDFCSLPCPKYGDERVTVMGGPAGMIGGGVSGRRDPTATQSVNSHFFGYGGLGMTVIHELGGDKPTVMHRIGLFGGRRQIFGIMEGQPEAMAFQ